MMKHPLFERCQAYLLAQSSIPKAEKGTARGAITISRQTGAGAITIAQLLADYLQKRKPENGPWGIFDRNLINHVLEDHLLPKRLEAFMPEDATSHIRDAVEEILGLHPSSWSLLQHTSETILKLAQRGNTIIVGRGSQIITANLKNVLHVRLVAPLEQRINHVREYYHLSAEQSEKFVLRWDRAHKRYLKQNFGVKIDDPLQHHLTINTGQFTYPEVARVIGDAARGLMENQVFRLQDQVPTPV